MENVTATTFYRDSQFKTRKKCKFFPRRATCSRRLPPHLAGPTTLAVARAAPRRQRRVRRTAGHPPENHRRALVRAGARRALRARPELPAPVQLLILATCGGTAAANPRHT